MFGDQLGVAPTYPQLLQGVLDRFQDAGQIVDKGNALLRLVREQYPEGSKELFDELSLTTESLVECIDAVTFSVGEELRRTIPNEKA